MVSTKPKDWLGPGSSSLLSAIGLLSREACGRVKLIIISSSIDVFLKADIWCGGCHGEQGNDNERQQMQVVSWSLRTHTMPVREILVPNAYR